MSQLTDLNHAIYRMVRQTDAVPGGELATVVELCERCLLNWLKNGWSITQKRSAWPPSGCRDCRLERDAV